MARGAGTVLSPDRTLFYDVFQISVGWMAALASDRGLVSLSLPQTKPQLAFSHLVMKVSGAEHRPGAFHSLQMAMESHFKGEIVTVNEPLDWRDTSAFSRQVLEIVQAIPPGQ